MAAMAAVIAFGVWTWVSRPPASSPPSSVRGGAVRLAILPPQNLTGDASIDQWPQLIQSLFADELAGVHGIAVIDPLGLNGLVEGRLDPASARQSPQLLNLLRRADVSLIVDGRILKAGVGYDLRINLVDPLSGETRFPAHATIAREDTLAATVTTLAANVLGFLQVQPLASDKDLRPAFSFGRHDIRAVNAFLEAAQYVYRDEHAKATAPLRRALQIDPTFVAPRIWLIPGLVATNNLAEARQHYQYLVNLRDLNPLERALTAYAGALIAHDRGGVAANLELALEYVPGNNILLFNLADIRALTGNCAGALDALKPEVAIRWRYPPVYALWGVCAIEMDRMPEARTVLTDAITLPHVYPSVYGFLEAIAIADGDAASAKRHRDRLDARLRELDQRDKSDMAVAYDHLGSSAYEAGHSDRAAILFRRALTLEPTSPHPQLMLRTINEDQQKEG
jgi:tetratricopeptide (TPR) repeat protein